jgi:hypothetical protein
VSSRLHRFGFSFFPRRPEVMEVVSTNHSQQLCPEVNNETAMQKYLHTHNLTPGYSNIHLISSIYLSVRLFIYPSIHPSIHLSICLSI